MGQGMIFYFFKNFFTILIILTTINVNASDVKYMSASESIATDSDDNIDSGSISKYKFSIDAGFNDFSLGFNYHISEYHFDINPKYEYFSNNSHVLSASLLKSNKIGIHNISFGLRLNSFLFSKSLSATDNEVALKKSASFGVGFVSKYSLDINKYFSIISNLSYYPDILTYKPGLASSFNFGLGFSVLVSEGLHIYGTYHINQYGYLSDSSVANVSNKGVSFGLEFSL